MRIQKRSHLLLEVVIALALVVSCTIPLMRTQLSINRRETHDVLQSRLELAASELYSDVLVDLYNQKIAYKDINHGSKHAHFDLGEIEIAGHDYTCCGEVSVAKHHKKAREDYRLYEIEISLESRGEKKTYLFNQFALREKHETD